MADFDFSRRDLLKLGVSAAAAFAGGFALAEPQPSPPMQSTRTSLLTRTVPKSGEQLPAVGLGTWQSFDVSGAGKEWDAAKEVLRLFVERGGKVVDSSPMYGDSESSVGQMAAELGVGKQLWIATKVWINGRERGIQQMEDSMRKLKAPRLDLMQVHNLVDVRTHLETLRQWKQDGRIRYVGITHYHSGGHPALEKLLTSENLDFVQFNYSLAEREAEKRLLAVAAETRTAVLINRPFAQAELFGKVRGKQLPEWAKEFDCNSWAQFFLKYVLGHPAVTCAIPATRNPKHIMDNMGAGVGRLPDEAMRRRMADHMQSL